MALTGLDPDVKASKCTIADYPDVIAKIEGAARSDRQRRGQGRRSHDGEIGRAP